MANMNAMMITRSLLRTAREIANEELDAPSIEAVLAVFYRLGIERDRCLDGFYDGSTESDDITLQ